MARFRSPARPQALQSRQNAHIFNVLGGGNPPLEEVNNYSELMTRRIYNAGIRSGAMANPGPPG
jgi:hypothetical protein